jgi:UDP-N-acetylmuramate--alanine ligase
MDLNNIKKIYCIGIGGIGVSSIARIFAQAGKVVSGSDLRASQITESIEKIGVKVVIGQKAENISNFQPDLVIYSEDVSEGSPGSEELNVAKQNNIPIWTQAEAVGVLMENHHGIGVTGTNGKSTTTALLGLILEQAQMDPTVILGTMLSPQNETSAFQANARFGQSEFVVAESDEYRAKMLKNKPQMIVVTNIAEDHLDYYRNLNEIKSAFSKYVLSLTPTGTVIYNADDHNTIEVCRESQGHKYTFGIKHYADLQALNLITQDGRQTFDMHLNDEKIESFELFVPGEFNVSNALGASLAAIKLGVPVAVIKKTLAEFKGTWRRFEKVGELNGKIIISDYAHHPAGVAGTIQAAREFYPGKKILTVFQPHHRNRTQKLFAEFISALEGAEMVILPEIFDVTGREHGEEISSKQLVDELNTRNTPAIFAQDLAQAGELIKTEAAKFDIILMMGAGDIDRLARELAK